MRIVLGIHRVPFQSFPFSTFHILQTSRILFTPHHFISPQLSLYPLLGDQLLLFSLSKRPLLKWCGSTSSFVVSNYLLCRYWQKFFVYFTEFYPLSRVFIFSCRLLSTEISPVQFLDVTCPEVCQAPITGLHMDRVSSSGVFLFDYG